MIVLGTRPEIIKFSAVIPLLEKDFENIVVHTNQHYSENLDNVFFEELKLKKPDYNLNVGSGTHAEQIAKILVSGGICAIEPSCGGTGASHTPSGPIGKDKWHEGYLIEYSAHIKAAVDVPVMVVGGMRDLQMLEDVINTGKGDFISMCRPFIREPHIANRWRSGDLTPARCVSCNKCLDSILDPGLSCIFNKDSVAK